MLTAQGWAGLVALAAACSYAGGAVLQQRAAGPTAASVPELGWRWLLRLAAHPLWLAGVALDGAGFLLEFTALRAGSLTLVQPLLVSGLLFALPFGAVLARRRISIREMVAAVLVCAGLSAALLAAHPLAAGAPAPGLAWAIGSGGTAVAVSALVLAGRGRGAAGRAVCWAAAAGMVNGLFAGFAKAAGVSWQSGWVALMSGWPVWALLLAAGVTLILAAKAFQTAAAAAAAAVTALFAVEPMSGVAVGALLFGETMRHTPVALAVETLGVLACLVGIALLARSPMVLAAYAGTGRPTDESAQQPTTSLPSASTCGTLSSRSPSHGERGGPRGHAASGRRRALNARTALDRDAPV